MISEDYPIKSPVNRNKFYQSRKRTTEYNLQKNTLIMDWKGFNVSNVHGIKIRINIIKLPPFTPVLLGHLTRDGFGKTDIDTMFSIFIARLSYTYYINVMTYVIHFK